MRSLANEIGRSTVGLYRLLKPSRLVKGNNPVFFIIPSQVTNRHTILTKKISGRNHWPMRSEDLLLDSTGFTSHPN